MNSSQSIKALRPLKGGIMFHEDFDVSSNNAIQSESKLIHEHDFITTRIKETNSFSFIALLAAYATVGYVARHWKIK